MTNEDKTHVDQIDGRKTEQGDRTVRHSNLDPHIIREDTQSQDTDSTEDEVIKIKWRLEKLKSSDTFERIMGDLEVKMVERRRQIVTIKNEQKRKESDTQEQVLLELDFDDEDDDTDDEMLHFNNPLRIKARRAWALIRRHIREKAMAKQNKSSLQWSMIKQTIHNMSNMSAGRQSLYEKYLDPDKPRVWTEGIKSIPADFFTRHSKSINRSRVKHEDRSNGNKSISRSKSAKFVKSNLTSASTSRSFRSYRPNAKTRL